MSDFILRYSDFALYIRPKNNVSISPAKHLVIIIFLIHVVLHLFTLYYKIGYIVSSFYYRIMFSCVNYLIRSFMLISFKLLYLF